jgi:hypothetical protein
VRELLRHTRRSWWPAWLGRPARVMLFVVAFLPWLGKYAEATQRHLDADELHHMHAAWCLAQGLVPHKDYFEHHTPGFYFQLAPVIMVMAPEESAADAWSTVLVCRRVMWLWAGALLALLGWLGTRWRDATVGALAVAVLSNLDIFWSKVLG